MYLCVDVATGATSLFCFCGATSSSCSSSSDSSLCVFPLCVCLAIFLFLGYVCCEAKVAAARRVVSMGCLSIGLGGREFSGFLLLFLLCLLREVVDFLCCALFWAGAACDVCSCCCFCCCVWQSLFSLVLMLLIMLIVLLVAIVSCHLV